MFKNKTAEYNCPNQGDAVVLYVSIFKPGQRIVPTRDAMAGQGIYDISFPLHKFGSGPVTVHQIYLTDADHPTAEDTRLYVVESRTARDYKTGVNPTFRFVLLKRKVHRLPLQNAT